MKTRFTLILLGVLALAMLTGLWVQHRAEAESAKKPVNFTLTDVNGKKVKMSSFRGKVVVVDVWATWCGYCVKEIPELIEMQSEAKHKKRPIQIIGISVDEKKNDVKRFAKERKINYPVLFAEKKAMKQFGEIYGLPTKFIINKDGVIVDKIIGATTKSDLEKRLAKHLK